VTILGDLRAGLSPAVEELLEGFDSSGPAPLTARERRVEWAAAAAFLAVAIPMAALLPPLHAPSVPFALTMVAAYAVASRIRFAIGYGFTVPTQVVFVPMLFLLPVGAVPLFVAAGIALGNLPDYLTRRSHPSRIVLAFGDSWHSVAPALVISLAGVADPGLSDWPVLVAALAAQLIVDFGASTVREWLALGISPRLQPSLLGWVALVDVLLSPLGLLAVLAAGGTPYAALLVLPLCGLLAMFAIERKARLAQALELSRAYRGTTLLLSDVLEADDEYTGLHSRSVVSLSVAVADELGLDSRERRNVEFGALLHDVGKIAVPKSIINKPGPLTADEWVVVKAHTIEGQRMLDRVGGLLSDVGRIVRSSHEWWDGSGYPDGLAGDQIPLGATVVSCCDAFNAITTDRPYRAARSMSEALQEMRAASGRQFNPLVVEALTRIAERSLVEEGAASGPRRGIHAFALPAMD
jgi:HD-GYP domain-containing protein (c-di-GMP phosphodiesterase class II)